MEELAVGRIVHLVLSPQDCVEIMRRRVFGAGHSEQWPAGAQAHVGNPVIPGEHIAMVVTAVWPRDLVSGQVLLDGNDSFWATSRNYDELNTHGTWHWIELDKIS